MALGSLLPGHGRVDVAGGVRRREPFQGPELVQSADGHHRPGRRPHAQGRAAVGTVRQGLDESGHVVPGDLAGLLGSPRAAR